MFAPDGSLRDVPQGRISEAHQNGMEIGVRMQAPDNTVRIVPASRYQEASQNGMTPIPIKDQEVPHPGFWNSLVSDLKGLVSSIPTVTSPYPGMDLERKQQVAQQALAEDQARKQAGYGTTYRTLAPVAESLGTNVPGMEQSAGEGDTSGVLGHAAAGATVASAPLTLEGLLKGATSPTAMKVARTGVEAGKFAGKVGDVAAFGRLSALYRAAKESAGTVGDIWAKPAEPEPPADPFHNVEDYSKDVFRETAPTPAPAPAPAVAAEEVAAPRSTGGMPYTYTGESALRQVLTGLGNQDLLKVAKSRGIDVTREAQLKPGVADNRIIGKIIDDFSPEELDDFRDTYLEATRQGRPSGVGPEAYTTKALQQFFPDLKLPQARLARTQKAFAARPRANTLYDLLTQQ